MSMRAMDGRGASVASGRITVGGTGRGVANLVVEAHHVATDGTTTRLGSTITTGEGTFAVELPGPSTPWFRRRTSATRNLQIRVLTPERGGDGRTDRLLFSSEVRRQAGPREVFPIELPAAVLEAGGVIPSTEGGVVLAGPAEAVRVTLEELAAVKGVAEGVIDDRLGDVIARRTAFRDEVRTRALAELSTVTDAERQSDRFVSTEDEIERRERGALKADIDRLVDDSSPVLRPGRLTLTQTEHDALFGSESGKVTVTEEELETALGTNLDKPPVLYRRHVGFDDPCRPRTPAEECIEGPPPRTEQPDTGSGSSTGTGPSTTAFDKDAAIAELLDRQTAPEDPLEFGREDADLERPLTAGGVSDVIDGVVFEPGPADVPAFYDFHDLQIAFEPVWQEALDDRFLDDVEEVYDRIVERGGAPAAGVIGGFLTAPPPPSTSPRFGFLGGFLDTIWDIAGAVDSEVPAAVVEAVAITLEEWQALPASTRRRLSELAGQIRLLRDQVRAALDPSELPPIAGIPSIGELVRAANTTKSIGLRAQIELLTLDAERIAAHARLLLIEREARKPFQPTVAVIDRLRQARSASYPFRYFAASPRHRSVNFGLMVTYRQQWTPVSYQVGELVSTIPLAPKEVRRVSKRTVVKTRRAQQEIESNLSARRGESEQRSRSEAEIVARATAKTNFSLSKSGTMNIGEEGVGGSATTTTTFTRDAERHSSSVKKEFREAILKSAEEYRNERKIELTTEETYESEYAETTEIQNPNDEIPATFLFYELQRRFQLSEKLHRLQSVVLIAQEVPAPSDIDSAWLIRHDWILNRVLLDDSFRPALTYVSTTLISEEIALREMRDALLRQRKLVEELKEEVADRRALVGLRYAALQRQIERTARSAGGGGGILGGLGDVVGGIPVVGDAIQGGLDLISGGGGPSEEAQIREGAARDAFDREQREEEALLSRLTNAIATSDSMQRDYTERLGAHLREVAQVERLSSHIVQNVMHYMQAIWAHEPDDQRFLRLRDVPVPVFEKDKSRRQFIIDAAAVQPVFDVRVAARRAFPFEVDFGIRQPPSRPEQIETKPLWQVAEIDRPLGFIGNYMIFPMMEANPITEFMMEPYVTLAEGQFGISDPDPLGNMTLDEFADYVCCLRQHFSAEGGEGEGGEGEVEATDPFEELKPWLRETLRRLLQLSLRNDEEVIVPTGSLYIEALPGAHSVMERFKHLHRQIDVKMVQETVRRAAIDNVRRAQRILDGNFEDPDFETSYLFQGVQPTITAPTDGGGGGGGGGP